MRLHIIVFGITSAVMGPHLVSAQIADRPFALSIGQYKVECWSTNVTRQADGSENHTQSYQMGVNTVTAAKGSVMEALSFCNESGVKEVSMTRMTKTEDLGNGIFLQHIENIAGSKKANFDVKIKVSGNLTTFISVTRDGQVSNVSGRESSWQKMKDGRVVVQDYLVSALANDFNNLHSHTMCIFTPDSPAAK